MYTTGIEWHLKEPHHHSTVNEFQKVVDNLIVTYRSMCMKILDSDLRKKLGKPHKCSIRLYPQKSDSLPRIKCVNIEMSLNLSQVFVSCFVERKIPASTRIVPSIQPPLTGFRLP
jgi:hypothetical protein